MLNFYVSLFLMEGSSLNDRNYLHILTLDKKISSSFKSDQVFIFLNLHFNFIYVAKT